MVNQDNHNPGNLSLTDDNEIITRILSGEKNLYTLIIRKYNQRLYRIALSIINTESDVYDVIQLAYIKAYENLGQFRFQSAFSTWLTKILINESLMFLKKKKHTALMEKKKFEEEAEQSKTDMQTPLTGILHTELKSVLESSIRELPEKYRTVFIMRELENISVAETMEYLGLSESNVKIRFKRSKVMLRNKLKVYLKDEDVLQLYKPHCDKILDYVMKNISNEQAVMPN